MQEEINPFDILSGKAVQNRLCTFYFNEAGCNMQHIAWAFRCRNALIGPVYNAFLQRRLNYKLHKENGPAVIYKLHRENGPAVIYKNGITEYWLNGNWYNTEEAYNEAIKCIQK